MRLSRVAAWIAFTALLILPGVSRAGQEPSIPKPGPEHEFLKMDEGVWDASVELTPGPGVPPMASKGVETNVMGCGGLCLISDYKGELMPGVTFHGHGTTTWDVVKKRYIASWTDSMSQGLAIGEATYDPAKKLMNGSMEGPDAAGNIMKTRTVAEYKGDTRVMTGYTTGPDGKEFQIMKITYTRRK